MKNTRLVYSSDRGRMEPARAPRTASTTSSTDATREPRDGIVRIFRERGGRNGKIVTVIRGLPERGAALDARAAELKRLCGAGGTTKEGSVEVQGDHRERIADHLRTIGYTVKLAGG